MAGQLARNDAGPPLCSLSNEVGLGLVLETPLGRSFRDAQGRLNQIIAAAVPDRGFRRRRSAAVAQTFIIPTSFLIPESNPL